ncbi:MAG: WD40 repeat domain-containing protein [Verrucomicrobiales bacterium]|nr:WD40 repeat domain-containing protein [Verrucomicrobiales bacterium]
MKSRAARGYLHGIHSAAFSSDGRRIAMGGSGVEAVRLWDLESGQPLLTLNADRSAFQEIGFTSDGNLLGSSTVLGVLHLWRAPSWNGR